ncbi:MAG TPA: LysM peptidoglycan-binding domain-containing protein [Puia sp.]|nr:LysM peptidoglycan-binding domain-containing protein [Puia sp.]
MKRFIFMAIFALSAKLAVAQSHDLDIHNDNGRLYLLHHVVAKENWYSIGRIYNAGPKEIAPFNGLTLNYSLRIGQELKIPLGSSNFSQDGRKEADETFVPVYHIVETNETFAHISSLYNRVSIENLEKWNRIKKETVKQGTRLIVGYIKVKTSISYLARGGADKIDAIAETKNTTEINQPVVKEDKKVNAIVEEKQEIKPVTPTPSTSNPNKAIYTNTSNNSHLSGGYFSPDFTDGGNKASGTAGTFKSTSGWNDGKYYALINNVPVGTIVKIIAPATQKSVYAKVLGQLPDMKESEGLLVRISNAAANELGEPEGQFGVLVKY